MDNNNVGLFQDNNQQIINAEDSISNHENEADQSLDQSNLSISNSVSESNNENELNYLRIMNGHEDNRLVHFPSDGIIL